MPAIDPGELQKWLNGDLEPFRPIRVCLGVWHNLFPSFFGWSLSPWRLIFGTIRGLSLVFITLWPIWIKYADQTSSATWGQTLTLSALIILAVVYNHGYDRFVK